MKSPTSLVLIFLVLVLSHIWLRFLILLVLRIFILEVCTLWSSLLIRGVIAIREVPTVRGVGVGIEPASFFASVRDLQPLRRG